MSERHKRLRRIRYHIQRKKCQRCGQGGDIYTLEDFITNENVATECYCPRHAHQAGFCVGCGQFWGGICSFEMSKSGLCDHCQDNLDADFNYYDREELDYDQGP